MNAQDIPNNPYSAEALQRRLSQTKSPSKVIDVSSLALASKPIEDAATKSDGDDGKSLQIVLGHRIGEPDQLRLVTKLFAVEQFSNQNNVAGTVATTISMTQK